MISGLPPYNNAVGYPGNCDFDKGLCNFVQDKSDDFDWICHSGGTPSYYTGPTSDHSARKTGKTFHICHHLSSHFQPMHHSTALLHPEGTIYDKWPRMGHPIGSRFQDQISSFLKTGSKTVSVHILPLVFKQCTYGITVLPGGPTEALSIYYFSVW